MVIGIEAQRLFRRQKHGVEIVALEIIKHLQLVDKVNRYYIFVKQDVDNTCISETENFKIVIIPDYSYPIWEQFVLPSVVKKYELDVLHCTASTAPFFSPVKTVITLHDIIFLEELNFKGTAYQNMGNIYRRLLVPLVARKNFLVTVSDHERQSIINRLKIPPDKIEVAYNAVSPEFKKITDETQIKTVREKYNLPEEFILFFANPAPKKNTEKTLLAFADYCKKYNNPKLKLLITDTTVKYTQALINALHLDEIADRIQVINYILHTDLPSVYSIAKLYLYPSTRESFGLPILEAMACGTPVITSNTAAMPEVAGGAALLVNPANYKDISEKMAMVLENEGVKQMLQQKGLDNIQRFNWKNTAYKMIEIYKKVSGKEA